MVANKPFGIVNVIVEIIAKWHLEHLQENVIIIHADVWQQNT